MDVTSIEVQEAIEQLKRLSLVMDSSGGRSIRFAHNLDRVLKIPVQSLALITVLMLRGPQTAGELRINSERLHKFADISSVESFLEELIERSEGPLVMKLPRQPGSRESRWVHLLSGEPEMSSSGPLVSTASVSEVDLKTLRSDIARLEAELVALRKIVEELATRVGFSTE